MPWAISRSTFSTTTIASSTTTPIASTSPNSDRLLRLKPRPAITENVPTSEIGIATTGISVACHRCRKMKTVSTTSPVATKSVWKTSAIDSSTNRVGL